MPKHQEQCKVDHQDIYCYNHKYTITESTYSKQNIATKYDTVLVIQSSYKLRLYKLRAIKDITIIYVLIA